MKQFVIYLLLMLSCQVMFPQENKGFNALWKEVGILEKQQLTSSAAKLVHSILEKAREEHDAPQMIKALLYSSRFNLVLEEDARTKVIDEFRSAIAQAGFPVKNVLEGYLANLYWQYFQENRYRFYDRSATDIQPDGTDFRSWDLTTLFGVINAHFEKALSSPAELQNVDIADFDLLINREKDSRKYRPTLFDLLAHAALEFYRSEETAITRPAESFELTDPEILCEAPSFISYEIPRGDSLSLQVKALKLYQQLLKFHQQDSRPDAFVDVDLERLKFIYQNAVFEEKEKRFEEILKTSAARYPKQETTGLYAHEIAVFYKTLAEQYQPDLNEEYRWKRKAALDLCDSVIAEFPGSPGAGKCSALRAAILSPELQILNESHIPAKRPSKLLVQYRNLDKMHLEACRITREQQEHLKHLAYDKQLPFIKNLKAVRDWDCALKNEKDYQSHATEVLLPALKNGLYVIFARPEREDRLFAFGFTQVTNIALLEASTQNFHTFQAVDRNDGRPLPGAKLDLTYGVNFDRRTVSKSFITDSMGMVTMPLSESILSNVDAVLTKEKDTAFFGEYYIRQKSGSPSEDISHSRAFLFTDRSIYRPGQTLYFKGIVVTSGKKDANVSVNTPLTITLQDVNGQAVAEAEFRTNEFGSISGEFILPVNGLTGGYSLNAASGTVPLEGHIDFSVEEYKRPAFQISFDPVTGAYRANDSITLTGSAIGYAGTAIGNARVVYSVQRIVYFPPWYYSRRSYQHNSPQEIAHGETHTDASGNYRIGFLALPDKTVQREDMPIFNYEVAADITDINGETHRATSVVRAGYHTLTASVKLPGVMDKDSNDHKVILTTANLNGEPVPAKGTLRMYKLVAPEQVLRERPWPAPDYKSFTREKFRELFPHEAYDNESDAASRAKGAVAREVSFDTGKTNEVALVQLQNLESGAYLFEMLTEDTYGQEVRAEARMELYSDKDRQLADNQLFDIRTDRDQYAVGDEVHLSLASNLDNGTVTISIEKDGEGAEQRVVALHRDNMVLSIPVTREDLGGFAINYSFPALNTLRSGSISVDVPYPDPRLDIETTTFRDLLEPGARETWSFHISGPDGGQVASELLAGMYDASLDAFREHSWDFDPFRRAAYSPNAYFNGSQSFGTGYFQTHTETPGGDGFPSIHYESWNWFGLTFRSRLYRLDQPSPVARSITGAVRGVAVEAEEMAMNDAATIGYFVKEKTNDGTSKPFTDDSDGSEVATHSEGPVRKNLMETAFFYPHLRTDGDGNVSFSFSTPEALTRWKLLLLAHGKHLENGKKVLETTTQKELMVIPNMPRFLREGDTISLSAKIANMTGGGLSGEVRIELTDALTGRDISRVLLAPGQEEERPGLRNDRDFEVDPLGNAGVSWRLAIPSGIQVVQVKIMAKSGDFSDGEQRLLPVMTNRILVTETMPMWVGSNQSKTFVLEKLRDQGPGTLRNHQLTLEVTANPAWYAVQALPYLMEYPYDCNEQVFSRYYANALASQIVSQSPEIREVFSQWQGTDALKSSLEKNEELKSLLIQETPWLRDAESETEQKKRTALLFDLNTMRNGQERAFNQLRNNQMQSGAWAWFAGGRPNRYITQHIVTGFGYLHRLQVPTEENDSGEMLVRAMDYLDEEFLLEYEQLKKDAKDLSENHLSYTQVHYLYARSFFKDIKTSDKVARGIDYYMGQIKRYWMDEPLYSKGLMALVMYRSGETGTAEKILRSLKENSITSEEMGMYWKENTPSWYWYQAPVETQALMVSVFSEIGSDREAVDNLKIWLLRNKQANQWKTTKATTDAVYALLMQGTSWLSPDNSVDIRIAGKELSASAMEGIRPEAGLGYFKTAWKEAGITPKMSEVTLTKKGEGPAWGALYWQYFEDLDKISPSETPLKVKKKLFLRKNTSAGEALTEITKDTRVTIGDLIRVRIEINADRSREFVHMKDMRASGLEPVNVLSGYRWQDGTGFYESTRDASTNFFFDLLPKGIFIIEYDLRVNNAGEFSNGITTIQSMYAPEFSSHSKGQRINTIPEQPR